MKLRPFESKMVSNLKGKRDGYLDKIKKEKREDLLKMDRLSHLENEQEMLIESLTDNKPEENRILENLILEWQAHSFSETDFSDLVRSIFSGERLKRHYGLIGLGKLIENNERLIQSAINAKLVPRLKEFMLMGQESILQKEATNLIRLLAGGTTQQTQTLIENGMLVDLIILVKSASGETLNQAIWALANIAGDCVLFRDMILRKDGLEAIINSITEHCDANLIRLGVWAILALTQGSPAPPSEDLEPAIPILITVVQKIEDYQILTDAFWALSNISNEQTQAEKISAFGIVPRLVHCLYYPHTLLLRPCLRTLGNIFLHMNKQKSQIKEFGSDLVPTLFKMAQNVGVYIRKEAHWVLSNLVLNTLGASEMIMSNPYYVDMLIKTATSDNQQISLEALWIISLSIKDIQQEQVSELVELGVLDCLLYSITSQHQKTLEVALEAIHDILSLGESITQEKEIENPFLLLLEEKGGISKLERLQLHPEFNIYSKAMTILEDFFYLDEIV